MYKESSWLAAQFAVTGVLLVASGCTTLGPDFQRPEVDVEQDWMKADDPAIVSSQSDNSDWWALFNDPILNSLVEQAYQQNLPLQIAGLRILEARAQLGVAVSDQYPQLQQAGGALTQQRVSENSPNFNPLEEKSFAIANAGFDAAWELDFWGQFRRGVESSSANLGSQIASYDNALVSLTAEVSRVYVLIRTVEEQLAVLRSNVERQRKGYKLANAKFRAGAVSELDPAQALTLLRSTQSKVPVLESRIRKLTNSLSILLGMPPQDLTEILGHGTIPTAPNEVAVGIPADLLRRRPDIRQAELQAASQSALIGVAEAELYPQFGLVGSIGLLSSNTNKSNLTDLFDTDSFTYSLGPSFAWPIFNYGRLKNNVRVQDARLEELLVNYQNTVLEAAREVEDGLAGFLGAKSSANYLSQGVKAADRAVYLSLLQYRAGRVSYQRVLDSQQTLLTEEDAYTSARGEVALNLVSTYKALGGGWQIRGGKDFLPAQRLEQMRKRTDWGDLIPGDALPDDLPDPPPTGDAQPLLNKPDW